MRRSQRSDPATIRVGQCGRRRRGVLRRCTRRCISAICWRARFGLWRRDLDVGRRGRSRGRDVIPLEYSRFVKVRPQKSCSEKGEQREYEPPTPIPWTRRRGRAIAGCVAGASRDRRSRSCGPCRAAHLDAWRSVTNEPNRSPGSGTSLRASFERDGPRRSIGAENGTSQSPGRLPRSILARATIASGLSPTSWQ